MSLYKSNQNTRLTVRYSKSRLPSEKASSAKLQKEMDRHKKEMIEKLNIKNYEIKDKKITRSKDLTIVVSTGSYKSGASRKLIHFAERHYYIKGRKLQMLLTNPDSKKLAADNQEKSVSKLRKKYISKRFLNRSRKADKSE